MNTKQFLSDILDEFNKIDYVKPEDNPEYRSLHGSGDNIYGFPACHIQAA